MKRTCLLFVVLAMASCPRVLGQLSATRAPLEAARVATRLPQVQLVGRWMPTPAGTAQVAVPRRLMIQALQTGTSMQVNVPGFSVEEAAGPDGITYKRLRIPNGGLTADIGKPELPTVGTFVEVPAGMHVQVTATPVGQGSTFDDYLIWPAQEQPIDKAGAPEPPFAKDAATYAAEGPWPPGLVYSTRPGMVRGSSVVNVIICPFRYSPARRQLTAYGEVDVRVTFTGSPQADWEQRREKYATPEFAPVLKSVVPTFRAATWLRTPALSAVLRPISGCDYLIICPAGWEDTAAKLATWREATGLRTMIVKTSDISGGATADNIAAYIKNGYDNWTIVPSYVLLLGDANFIPLFYRTVHPHGVEAGLKTGTDLYYATVDGDDLLPDIALGRLPASSEAEAGMMIDKVIAYEQTPPAGAWFGKVLVASGYQSGRYFHITSDAIAGFLTGKGYNVSKVYNGGPYTGTPAQVSAAINDGVVLVTHRDHGDSTHGPSGYSDGWSEPNWGRAQAAALTNGGKQPVVFTLNCRTGWFDDETDKDTTDPGGDSLAEALIRGNNKGAVAVIGATRVSYSGYNDEFAKGLIDGIWPDFDPGYSGAPAAAGPRLGLVLNAGKMWMYDKYVLTGGGSYGYTVTPIKTTTEFEIFHLLGDPAMRIWTGAPSQMIASLIKLEGNHVRVGVSSNRTPVAGALVVIQKPGEVAAWKKGVTNAGGQWETDLDPADQQVWVTATKPGQKPYHGLLTPVPAGLRPMRPAPRPGAVLRPLPR